MLKRIYLRYNDKIVDLYLDGKIKSPTPRLIKIKKDDIYTFRIS